MITEKLNKRLIWLTCIVAIATVLLVGVPFITPSLESQRLGSKIVNAQVTHNSLQEENSALKRELEELKQGLTALNKQVQI